MKKLLIIGMTLLMFGCNTFKEDAEERVPKLVYSKDYRTNMCFASYAM